MRVRTLFLVALTIVLLSACIVPSPQAPPVEPNAGTWQTWVVTDVATVRPLVQGVRS